MLSDEIRKLLKIPEDREIKKSLLSCKDFNTATFEASQVGACKTEALSTATNIISHELKMSINSDVKNLLKIPEDRKIKKSIIKVSEINKASNDWGRKIPVKKQTSDGRMITYWVSPEELNQGKMKGQQNLFGDDEMNQGPENEDSYYSQLDKNTELYKVKPLVEQFKETEKEHPGLSERIAQKYVDYIWGRDTRDLDIELDYQTAKFYKDISRQPEYRDEFYKEFLENTDKLSKRINNRKMAMARLKVGSPVEYKGNKTKIEKLSARGYPIVKINGEEKRVFVDEIVNFDNLFDKYGKAA